jgi:uncharacterized protein
MIKKILVICILFLVASFSGYVALIHVGANRGNSFAQGELGHWYDSGKWLHSKNQTKALYWYLLSAEAENEIAQFNLGLLLTEQGNYEKAAYWYLRAAQNGVVQAQFNLSIFYKTGKGLDKDLVKAFFWTEKAAMQGHANAQFNLAIAYLKGLGTTKNLVKAFDWTEKAAKNNVAISQTQLGAMYALGQGTPKNLSLALYWAQKGLNAGDTKAKELIESIHNLEITEK